MKSDHEHKFLPPVLWRHHSWGAVFRVPADPELAAALKAQGDARLSAKGFWHAEDVSLDAVRDVLVDYLGWDGVYRPPEEELIDLFVDISTLPTSRVETSTVWWAGRRILHRNTIGHFSPEPPYGVELVVAQPSPELDDYLKPTWDASSPAGECPGGLWARIRGVPSRHAIKIAVRHPHVEQVVRIRNAGPDGAASWLGSPPEGLREEVNAQNKRGDDLMLDILAKHFE